jgi:hypothetical protein
MSDITHFLVALKFSAKEKLFILEKRISLKQVQSLENHFLNAQNELMEQCIFV